MKSEQRIEKYVRGKTISYNEWRAGKTLEQLEQWCAECLFIHGILPHWVAYAHARRTRNWVAAQAMGEDQDKWRAKVEEWAFSRGITSHRLQGAQFYRYYSAWYRYKWEQENGPTTRPYARQIY